jgi:hypothetical protein
MSVKAAAATHPRDWLYCYLAVGSTLLTRLVVGLAPTSHGAVRLAHDPAPSCILPRPLGIAGTGSLWFAAASCSVIGLCHQ